MYSRYLQLKDVGLDILILGICDEDRTVSETVRDMRVCFVNRKSSGQQELVEKESPAAREQVA